ncbi:hypothetical protein DFH08DRAFT_886696 [Mycena albidolilacea]|uniref:RING-type domain-containing protein n=1 Tax=Mycena albidolilacea TaxID=1033008 RepID=A0AAD6ZIR5_9AGAR|nr:hypothetical protein DFH08DRAFT_886696 [Mycena albidolilacea]
MRVARILRSIPTGISILGWRKPRVEALVHADLWVAGEGPPEQLPILDHHECGICRHVKSHPVSYLCGHSHCYVCIRLSLEHEWTCPDCRTPMYHAPFRHWGEEASLASTYPDWNDESIVNYGWDGLIFPKAPEVLVPDSP